MIFGLWVDKNSFHHTGQMERIPGITEGAISAVLIMMKKQELAGISPKDKRDQK